MKIIKTLFVFILIILISSGFILTYKADRISTVPAKNTTNNNLYYGIVEDIILDKTVELDNGDEMREQYVKINLTNSNTQIETIHRVPVNLNYKLILKPNDKITLHTEDSNPDNYIIDGYKIDYVAYILAAIFVILILAIGGIQGVSALVALGIQGLLLIYLLIPAIKLGYSPVLSASIFCALATLTTMILVSGWNKKTFCSTAGTVGGMVVASLIGIWSVNASHITGLIEQETQGLYHTFNYINLPELITAGVLIGALGATMDVAMSIASSLKEIHDAAPQLTWRELFKSGMNIGRDIMGTMVNTLILAYAGSALATIILFTFLDLHYLLNTELLMEEIIMSVVGSIGLILTIPLTASISSSIYTWQNK